MNNTNLLGRVVREIEVKYTPSQVAVARLTLAIDRPVKAGAEKQTDFINCVAFGKQAETLERYVGKGGRLAVSGRIQTGSYEKQDGTKVYTTDVVIERFDIIDWKDSNGSRVVEEKPDSFEAIDEDVPF